MSNLHFAKDEVEHVDLDDPEDGAWAHDWLALHTEVERLREALENVLIRAVNDGRRNPDPEGELWAIANVARAALSPRQQALTEAT